MKVNFYKVVYEENGVRKVKEFTSTTKSTLELRSEANAVIKSRGWKVRSSNSGTRNE